MMIAIQVSTVKQDFDRPFVIHHLSDFRLRDLYSVHRRALTERRMEILRVRERLAVRNGVADDLGKGTRISGNKIVHSSLYLSRLKFA